MSQVERGIRNLDSHGVLNTVAIMRVEIEGLADSGTGSRSWSSAVQIEHAFMAL
jgi:hypothetical protein